MTVHISEKTRNLLARSLPLVHQRKREIIGLMEINLRGVDGAQKAFGQPGMTAMLLTELLLGQARAIVESGRIEPPDNLAAEHRTLDIVGRHYSRFGDALVPILRDLLGPATPREVPSAWCDTFWAIVRAIAPKREEVEA